MIYLIIVTLVVFACLLIGSALAYFALKDVYTDEEENDRFTYKE